MCKGFQADIKKNKKDYFNPILTVKHIYDDVHFVQTLLDHMSHEKRQLQAIDDPFLETWGDLIKNNVRYSIR